MSKISVYQQMKNAVVSVFFIFLIGIITHPTHISPSAALTNEQAPLGTGTQTLFLPMISTVPPSIWLDRHALGAQPTSGPAWNELIKAAQENTLNPDINDNNDRTDVHVMAKALVYARTGQTKYRDEVRESITAVIGSEGDGNDSILGLARNLQGYIIAADLIMLHTESAEDTLFRDWLTQIRNKYYTGGSGYTLITCHEERPNNIGLHCGASRIAIALYLEDTADLDQAATVFKGWLGDRDAYSGFNFGDLSWQCDPSEPVGINPAGCEISGAPVGGILPDDQRRGGTFSWPPAKENYVWEALQGAVVQANLLSIAGYDAWKWQDQALLRAVDWLYNVAAYAPEGDDRWIAWLINDQYGTSYATETPTTPGKGIGWTDWTHK